MTASRPQPRVRPSPTAAAVALAFAPLASQAANITVTNNADSGPGSLRDAMTIANAGCLTDPAPTIVFAISGTAPFTIAPSTPLPTLSCGLGPFSPQIDATTQSGYAANTSATGFNGVFGIVLDGASMNSPGCGLHYNDPSFYGGELTIRGMDVKNFAYSGSGQALCGFLRIYGNRVQSSSTGVAIGSGSGAAAIGSLSTVADRNVIANNVFDGISVSYGGSVFILNNLIGTPDGSSAPTVTQIHGINWGGAPSGSSISGNVISGNGVGINLSSDNGTTISNNKIGTDGSGTAALANQGAGIMLTGGGGTSISNNVISGNGDFGIVLSAVSSASIDGNQIGTTVTGLAALANFGGIAGSCSTNITVNGNLISGNLHDAIQFFGVDGPGAPASPTNIQSNLIGVANDQVTPLGNGGNGIYIDAGSSCFVGTGTGSHNVMGANTIANNAANGISLRSGVGNAIPGGNSIYANGIKNININNTVGPLPNDPGDPDGGPNNQQNYPVISSVTQSGGNTLVAWSLDSTVADGFEIDFFANPATGTPAGKTWLGNIIVPSGAASGTQTISGLFDHISMSALDGNTGDSSEFSPIVSVVASPGVTIAPTSLSFGNVAVGGTSASQSSTVTSSGSANYQINKFDTNALCYGAPLCYGGPFVCSTNCSLAPTQYAPTQSCTITASFAPTSLGPQSSTIYLCDNTSASPNTITLSGTGVAAPPVGIAPTSQDFGSVPVGTTSYPNVFSVYNTSSTTPTTLSGGGTTGPFQIVQSTCGSTLGPSASCSVSITFAPTSAGPASGTFFVQSGASSTSSSLTGTGVNAPQVAIPPPVDLGAGTLGVSSLTQTITLTNTGNATLTFSSIAVTSPFTLTNNCPTSLGPGQSCDLVIGLDPNSIGEFSGTLTIVSNGGSGTVPLTGRIQPVPVALLRVGPNAIGFGDRVAGSTSPVQRITVTNDGGQPAAMTAVNVSPDFVVAANSCTGTLAPQASCFVDVAMRAIGFGMRLGQVVIGSNASNAPLTVSLSGTGCRPFDARSSRFGPRSNCAP